MTPDWAAEVFGGFHFCPSSVVSNSHCGGSCGFALSSLSLVTRCLGFTNRLGEEITNLGEVFVDQRSGVSPD